MGDLRNAWFKDPDGNILSIVNGHMANSRAGSVQAHKEGMIVAKQVGLWIDHRKAFIVTDSAAGDATQLVESNVERHGRYSGHPGAGEAHGSREGAPEDTRERHFEGELAKYYDEVIACIRDAEAILILGPGEAKGELKARLEHDGLASRIVGVETVDKMTDHQVVAKVREHFAE